MNGPETARSAPEFLLGVVEGFYGRSWSHTDRLDYARLHVELGFNASLYCPKGDACLRREWRRPWPETEWRRLRELAATYEEAGIAWGVGLSPFELYARYDGVARRDLQGKISRINELQGSLLAVLFDDMPGELEDLAERQLEIVADIQRWTAARRLLVCPTYYSTDPVLEQYFGRRPEGYWGTLGAGLDPDIDLFWTGNSVCSKQVRKADLARITEAFRRAPILWDNYPVNDGAGRSQHLFLDPLPEREPGLEDTLGGHFCNPMNQSRCSLPALLGLARLYGRGPADGTAWLARQLGEETWDLLCRDRREFQDLGLAAMAPARREALAAEYGALAGPAAAEVVAWLRGEYAFDPACLTG